MIRGIELSNTSVNQNQKSSRTVSPLVPPNEYFWRPVLVQWTLIQLAGQSSMANPGQPQPAVGDQVPPSEAASASVGLSSVEAGVPGQPPSPSQLAQGSLPNDRIQRTQA